MVLAFPTLQISAQHCMMAPTVGALWMPLQAGQAYPKASETERVVAADSLLSSHPPGSIS